VDDKDASVFRTLISDPSGQTAVALMHRPLFPGTRPEGSHQIEVALRAPQPSIQAARLSEHNCSLQAGVGDATD